MEGCLYNVGRLHWLRVAPQVRPRIYTSWLRDFFPSIPSSVASRTYHPCSDIPICARETTNLQRRRCLGSNSSSWSLIVSSSSEAGERVKEEEEEKRENIPELTSEFYLLFTLYAYKKCVDLLYTFSSYQNQREREREREREMK